MSAVPVPISAPAWPADVQAFAASHQVADYLEALREASRGVFPTGVVRVFLEDDPEIRDEWHIVYEIRAPRRDVPHSVQKQHFWIDELYRLCPAPLVCTFRLRLQLED